MAAILIVDDNPGEVHYARLRLEASGYTVLAAGSGDEALGRVAEKTVDLVLLDVVLPGMDRFEVCRRIRAWELEAYATPPSFPW